MAKMPLYERDVVSVRGAAGCANIALIAALVALVPLIMEFLTVVGAMFQVVVSVTMMIFALFIILLSVATLFLVWAIESFRNFFNGIMNLVTSGGDIANTMQTATNVVFGAYGVVCPLSASVAAVFAALAIVLSVKNKGLPGNGGRLAKGIVAAVFALTAVIGFYVTSPNVLG